MTAASAAEPTEPARVSSQSMRANFTVYAESLATADAVVLQGERLHQRFVHDFGLDPQRSRIPIVIVFGAGAKPSGDEGAVRVFPKSGSVKLQVNWDETPVFESAFRDAWVRALCTRLAAEVALRQARDGPKPDDLPELRVPIWVTDGVAMLLADPSTLQEIEGRGTLWARTEPFLTLSAALAELEGRSELDLSQKALAAVICRAVLRDPRMRERFFRSLNWPPKATAKDWVVAVTGREDLNTWWRAVWKEQSTKALWVKWAYGPTRDWMVQFEDSGDLMGTAALPAESGMSHTELAGVAHPWFRPLIKWRVSQHDRSLLEEELVKMRRSIESRRRVALDWFAPFETKEGAYMRQDWLAWERLHRDALKGEAEPGKIAAWFGSVAK